MMIRPFTVEDFKIIQYQLRNEPQIGLMPDIIERMKYYETHGNGITFLKNKEVVACGGVFELWPGVGEAWMFTTRLVKTAPIEFHKTTMAHIDTVIRRKNLSRVQAFVMASYRAGQKWLKALGFEKEGLLRKYSPDGSDYFVYGRVL